jgi:hypothetical protein
MANRQFRDGFQGPVQIKMQFQMFILSALPRSPIESRSVFLKLSLKAWNN